MSKVEELLEKYNPDGVEDLTLGEICLNHDSKRRPISKGNRIPGNIPYYGANGIQDYVDDYLFNGEYILVGEDGSVITEEGTPIVKWVYGKFWVNNHAHIFSENLNKALLKYVFYILQINKIKDLVRGVPPKLTKESALSISLKIPHIKVQEESVKILDSFTNLIDALNEELSLRQKQFEYYREKLLTFDDDVEKFIVTEVAQLKSGLTYKPSDVSDKGILVLRSSNIKNGFLSYDDNVFVKESTKISDRSIVRCNDILICVRNGSKKLVGKCAMIDKNADGMAFGAFMSVLRAKDINPKYLFYVWSSQIIQDKIKGDDAAPINQITSKDFNRLLIPVPKEQIQQSIVEKLDAFESLISSLKEEIALRQKQYEYYREKLLTFD